MEYSTEQAKAIATTDKSVFVSAGAGSGKTAVLTERIKNIVCLKKADIDELLVVTFTKAAASEMKKRIRNALIEEGEASKEKAYIYSQINLLDSSDISTLDSFCNRILREYYYTVDIDPSFGICESDMGRILFEQVCDEVFEKHYKENDAYFTDLTEGYQALKNEDKFKSLLREIYIFLYNRDDPFIYLDEKIEFFKNVSEENIVNFDVYKIISDNFDKGLNKAKDELKEAIKISQAYEYKDTEAFLLNNLTMLEQTEKLKKKDLNEFISFEPNFGTLSFRKEKNVNEKVKEKIVSHRKAANAIIKKAKKNFSFPLKEAVSVFNELYIPMKTLGNLLKEIDEEFLKLKKEKNIFEFHDISHLAIKILENEEINRELKDKYKYIFVDEYQDTNPVQERIINLISKEDNLFTVGDLKQSIYSFRLAEPELFKKRMTLCKGDTSSTSEFIPLNDNYRSSPLLIEGINAIFSLIMTEDIGATSYKEFDKMTAFRENGTDEKIELHLLELGLSKDDEDIVEQITKEEEEADYVASVIDGLMKEKIYDPNIDAYRKTEYSDICVLSRSVRRKNYAYINAFAKYSIPVNMSNAQGYFDLLEISMIIDFLRVTNNEIDDISLLGVMRNPIFSFSLDELLEIRFMGNGKSYYDSLKSYEESGEDKALREKIKHMLDTINTYRDLSRHMPTNELLQRIYDETNFLDIISAYPNGSERRRNLLYFRKKAKDYENFSLKGLHGFLRHIEKIKISGENQETPKKSEGEGKKVTFTSIHKSKGIEYPIIILCGIGDNFNFAKNDKSIFMEKSLGICPDYVNLKENYKISTPLKTASLIRMREETLSDEVRLFYVALTRAKERIIMTAAVKDIASVIQKANANTNDSFIYDATSHLDWLLFALRKRGELSCDKEVLFSDSLFKVIKASSDDLVLISEREEEKKEREPLLIEEGEITKFWDYEYPYFSDTVIPTKLNASSISEENLLNIGKEVLETKKLSFLSSENKKTNDRAKIGSLTHLLIEQLDFKELKETENMKEVIISTLNELRQKNIITEDEAEKIDTESVYRFFAGSLGKRLLASDYIIREKPFNIKVKAKDLEAKWDKVKDYILVQGIIDCFFENENGNITLIDFKTNIITSDERLEELTKHYESQINIYSEAIGKLLKKKVEEKILYFLNVNKAVYIK